MGNARTNNQEGRSLLHTDRRLTVAVYLELHMELTQLAWEKIKELEPAKDIASECLINCWKMKETYPIIYDDVHLRTELKRLCNCFLKQKKQLQHDELEYYLQWCRPISLRQAFRLDERMEVNRVLPMLDSMEQTVIQLILFEELDLEQIEQRVCRPIKTVKILRDRAVYQLKKKFNPKALPINQLTTFISLFFGTVMVTLKTSF